MKLGQAIDLHYSPRYFQFNRSHAIRDVFDALVELITNSDDSYHRLFRRGAIGEDGGPILIEHCEQRKGEGSLLVVRDRAEGMTLEEMLQKLGDVGTRRSEEGDRGFMARGAKDCTELGSMIVESIKDGKYYKCELTHRPQFIPWEKGKSVTKEIRETLGVERGNGTVVTIRMDASQKIPRIESIVRDLSWHFALRDILSEHSPTCAFIKRLGSKDKPDKLVYYHPEGELVWNDRYEIPGYSGVKATLKIWKHKEAFNDPSERFRRSGLLIKGSRAIHECSLLYSEFEKDSVYAKKYFGRIECDYIDVLLKEYDDRREAGETHPSDNPFLLIDPNRQSGLRREHPFTKAFFRLPAERLRALIATDKAAEKNERRRIASQETQSRLDQLAKAAGKFLKQQLEDVEELTLGESVDEKSFSKQGILLYPTYIRVALGETRTITVYVKKRFVQGIGDTIQIRSDSSALAVLDPEINLRPHKTKEDRFIASFKVRGEKITELAYIQASCNNLPPAEAIAEVVEYHLQDHKFTSRVEFEHKTYTLGEKVGKTLLLFAMCPEVVGSRTEVKVTCSDSQSIAIRGRCFLEPVKGANYAVAKISVFGHKIMEEAATLTATVNGESAQVKLRVKQAKEDEDSVQLGIDLRNEDFGNFRAIWAEHEGKPNLLLVSAKHRSLNRYLKYNPETQTFEGQNNPLFRVLLAEIVAESVCRKALTLESKEKTWEFRWADLRDDYKIADDVLSQLQKRVRNFVHEAHKIMLTDTELSSLNIG